MMTAASGHRPEPAAAGHASAAPDPPGLALLPAAAPLAGSPHHRAGINQAAIASLALAVASLVTFGLTTLPAIIFGHVALRQIRRTGQDGRAPSLISLNWRTAGRMLPSDAPTNAQKQPIRHHAAASLPPASPAPSWRLRAMTRTPTASGWCSAPSNLASQFWNLG